MQTGPAKVPAALFWQKGAHGEGRGGGARDRRRSGGQEKIRKHGAKVCGLGREEGSCPRETKTARLLSRHPVPVGPFFLVCAETDACCCVLVVVVVVLRAASTTVSDPSRRCLRHQCV